MAWQYALMMTACCSARETANILIVGRFGDGCGNNTTAYRIRYCTVNKIDHLEYNICKLTIIY